jgi:hypothetical protein
MADFAMPVAQPPPGDPAAFYATFAGKLTAAWNPGTPLAIRLDAPAAIAAVYAPIKSAMKYVPAGGMLAGAPVASNTVVLSTWPTTFVAAKETLGTAVPAEFRIANVDGPSVRAFAAAEYAALGGAVADVDAFMAGNGLLRVQAGAAIGTAAAVAGAPPATPNGVDVVLLSGRGDALNPLEFFALAADAVGINRAQHPLLAALPIDGWVELLLVDSTGAPIANTAYVLYLSDGTQRNGNSDAGGRVYETGLPAGAWQLDVPAHPSIELLAD